MRNREKDKEPTRSLGIIASLLESQWEKLGREIVTNPNRRMMVAVRILDEDQE